MLNKTINCAVIGLGIGEEHARALLTHSSVKLSAICDLDKRKITNFINKYKLSSAIEKSFSEILLNEDIHLVSIASFDDVHFEQVIDSLLHGKHVFVEKPLCQTEEQLKKIYSLWKKNNLGLSSNLLLRRSPLYVWLENLISSGELGTIYALDMDYLYGRIHKITEGWRSKVDNYSIMAGGGIHMGELIMLLLELLQILDVCISTNMLLEYLEQKQLLFMMIWERVYIGIEEKLTKLNQLNCPQSLNIKVPYC